MGKLLCWLRLHKHTMLGYGFNSTVNVECVRCKKRGVVSIWGMRP